MRIYAVVGTFLGWSALLLQLYLTLRYAPAKHVLAACITLLSYFTVLTNLLVSLVFTAVATRTSQFFRRPSVQASTAVYITIVGACYYLLLRQTWNPQGAQLIADRLMHYVVPVVYVVYWVWFAPRAGLRWKDAAVWLTYPGVYLAYTLARGALSGVYPYPFLDKNTLGYRGFFLHAATLTVVFLVTGFGVVAMARATPGRASS